VQLPYTAGAAAGGPVQQLSGVVGMPAVQGIVPAEIFFYN